MKIVSKFQDYYDCGLAYGVDENIVYTRTEHVERIKMVNGSNTREVRLRDNRPTRYGINSPSWYRLQPNYLHFCGMVYPFYRLFKSEKIGRDRKTGEDVIREWTEYYWDNESVSKEYSVSREKSRHAYNPGEPFDMANEWNVIIDDELNQRYQSPIVVEVFGTIEQRQAFRPIYHDVSEVNHIINPCLKDYGFGNLIDPYTAFQEISMYLGMLQNPEDKDLDPTATDVEKINQHGMDPVYGFRKPPVSK